MLRAPRRSHLITLLVFKLRMQFISELLWSILNARVLMLEMNCKYQSLALYLECFRSFQGNESLKYLLVVSKGDCDDLGVWTALMAVCVWGTAVFKCGGAVARMAGSAASFRLAVWVANCLCSVYCLLSYLMAPEMLLEIILNNRCLTKWKLDLYLFFIFEIKL